MYDEKACSAPAIPTGCAPRPPICMFARVEDQMTRARWPGRCGRIRRGNSQREDERIGGGRLDRSTSSPFPCSCRDNIAVAVGGSLQHQRTSTPSLKQSGGQIAARLTHRSTTCSRFSSRQKAFAPPAAACYQPASPARFPGRGSG